MRPGLIDRMYHKRMATGGGVTCDFEKNFSGLVLIGFPSQFWKDFTPFWFKPGFLAFVLAFWRPNFGFKPCFIFFASLLVCWNGPLRGLFGFLSHVWFKSRVLTPFALKTA
jgi:hypothetical protein